MNGSADRDVDILLLLINCKSSMRLMITDVDRDIDTVVTRTA